MFLKIGNNIFCINTIKLIQLPELPKTKEILIFFNDNTNALIEFKSENDCKKYFELIIKEIERFSGCLCVDFMPDINKVVSIWSTQGIRADQNRLSGESHKGCYVNMSNWIILNHVYYFKWLLKNISVWEYGFHKKQRQAA